jgi:hypothetical protein
MGWRIGAALFAWLAISASAAQRAGVSNPPHPHRHSLFAGQRHRRLRAHHRAEHAGAMEGLDRGESKSGANGSIAAEEVARAAPDGYTWLLVTTFLCRQTRPWQGSALDPVKVFRPDRADLAGAPNFFIVPSSLPVKSVSEFGGSRQGQARHAELQPSGQGLDGSPRF